MDLRGRSHDRLSVLPPFGSPVGDDRVAESQSVAVLEAVAALKPLVVHEGPVAGEAVVDDRPAVADPLELGVEAGDLRVPGQDHVGCGCAADRDLARGRVLERVDPLRVLAVPKDEEGHSKPFCLDAIRHRRERLTFRRGWSTVRLTWPVRCGTISSNDACKESDTA